MTWITKPKQLSLTRQTPHTSSVTGVVGRSPGFSTIYFGPLDLYGAAARCSHLHAINPALATPESHMIGALIEQYVDDVSSDFAILASAATFKDFVKSYFAGTVAAGLGYLAMIDDGYIWADHYENIGGRNSGVAKSPDFVFTKNGDVALMESKGTRSARLNAFDGTVESGYVDQVNPHLGYTVGGGIATHGFCIGSWLTSPTKAELVVHHTASRSPVAPGQVVASRPWRWLRFSGRITPQPSRWPTASPSAINSVDPVPHQRTFHSSGLSGVTECG